MTEEEVKLNYITLAIEKAGWDRKLIRMEYPITAGKIVVRGEKAFRLTKKRADYLLFYKENMPLAIVEAIEKFEPLLAEYEKLEQEASKLDSEIFDKIKKSVLQYAIQGKLVPQDPNDEPASVLFEKIRAEKDALIKQGKIKKDKNDSIIFKGEDEKFYEKVGNEVKDITGEIDFDLPSGWTLSRINSLVFIQTGASFKKESATEDKTQVRVLRGGNIYQSTYKFFNDDISIGKGLVNDRILLKQNDLITPAVTSIENIGKIARIEKDYENVTAGGFVFIVRPYYGSEIFSKYVLIAFQSKYFTDLMKSITKNQGRHFTT